MFFTSQPVRCHLFVSDKLAVYVGLNGDICFSLLPLVLMAISLLLQVLR